MGRAEDLLEEIKRGLEHAEALSDPGSLEDKMLGLSLYIEDAKGGEKRRLLFAYNELADKMREAGISVEKCEEEGEEKEVGRKRGESESKGEEETLVLSILNYSKELKRRSEYLGKITEESKSLIDALAGTVRKNVGALNREVSRLEKKEWWRLGRLDMMWILVLVVLAFMGMYVLIRVS
jgi:hypothetical protein